MRAKVLLLTILALTLAALAACSAAPTPAPTTAPGAAPATAAAPSGSTPLPLPAQPTVPPVAPRQATPFASATFAPILNFPAATSAATAAVTRAPTQPAGAQTTPGAVSGPTAPGVATGQRVELKLEFVKQLVSAEEVDEIAPVLKAIPGILSVTGNEVAITILYDPGLILPNQIRLRLAAMGHPVKE